MTAISFNFTPEQQEKFNLIYHETKKVHPKLVKDSVMKEKIKVLIAHTVINGDDAFKPNQTNSANTEIFTEI